MVWFLEYNFWIHRNVCLLEDELSSSERRSTTPLVNHNGTTAVFDASCNAQTSMQSSENTLSGAVEDTHLISVLANLPLRLANPFTILSKPELKENS